MPDSSMEGILNLIPKPGKDTRYVENLRPITLLNSDYKIVEKVLAMRMGESMSYIIHTDQKGFMPGRKISANIRKILDLITYTEQKNIEAFILSLDYQKCFDLISFDAILGSLKFFNFSDHIIKWTKILYTDYSVKIQNNGKFSEQIEIQRSVHQGGVNSVNLFLCVAEILALKLRTNTQIQGIPVNEIINLLNQFADDMDVCSKFDQNSLNNIISSIENFHYHTGFTINYDKTKIYRIGSLKNSQSRIIYMQKGINWTNDPINILGVWVSDDTETLHVLNYEPLLAKCKNVLSSWENRGLSLMGKILVINTLITSQFIYKMSVLPTLPENIIKKLEAMFINYIWDGKKAKIPIEILQKSKHEGGLGLVNLRLRDKALKISWIQTINQDKSVANLAYHFLGNVLKSWFFDCNLKDSDIHMLNISSPFWEDVAKAWCSYNFKEVHECTNFMV